MPKKRKRITAKVTPYALPLPQAAMYAGMGETKLRELIAKGIIKVSRNFSRNLVVKTSELERYVDAHELKSTNIGELPK